MGAKVKPIDKEDHALKQVVQQYWIKHKDRTNAFAVSKRFCLKPKTVRRWINETTEW